MPTDQIPYFLTLPELKITGQRHRPSASLFFMEKHSEFEVCPKCATPSSSTYDHRVIQVKDAPLRGKRIHLKIRKRRLWCKPCQKPFTEPVKGISKGYRSTMRYRRSILWACEHFTDLKKVRRLHGCSSWMVYTSLYEQLELQRRKRLYPWPKTVGIDEHSFKRKYGRKSYVTIVADYKGKRIMEAVDGKRGPELKHHLAAIPGRNNVKQVVMDLCQPYRRFVEDFFPQADVIADKFHVLRLLHPAINTYRKHITGDKRSNPVRWMLLRSGKNLKPYQRRVLYRWLHDYPELQELYTYKEALHRLYRTKGLKRATRALNNMCIAMAASTLPEILTLRKTLLKWKHEILNYFSHRITNARTESYNNLAKLVQRRAFGYKNFTNYRLRLLNACA